jgi:hypothetical protein
MIPTVYDEHYDPEDPIFWGIGPEWEEDDTL